MPTTCVLVVSPPAGGANLIAKTLLAMGYSAPGIPNDETNDWDLVAVNHIVCDRPLKPKIGLETAQYASEAMSVYVKDKAAENKMWVMSDSMLCMTFFDFSKVLKTEGVDFKVIIPMRQPHYSALDIIKTDKTWNLEEASGLLGKYIVARSLNTERFMLDNKDDQEKILHIDVNSLLDNTEETVKTIADKLGVELTDPIKEKIDGLIKPKS